MNIESIAERVAADFDVTLEPVDVTRVDIRLRAESVLPASPYGVRATLRSVDIPRGHEPTALDPTWFGRERTFPTTGTFGADRLVTGEAWTPGRYRVDLHLMQSGRTTFHRDGVLGLVKSIPAEPIVTITGDGRPVTIEVAIDPEDYARLTSGK